MADRVEQQLLGYLLDALDASEQERVEEQLAHDPAVRHQLNQLREAFPPLEATRKAFEPPEGRAGRRCVRGPGAGPAAGGAAPPAMRARPPSAAAVGEPLADAVAPP